MDYTDLPLCPQCHARYIECKTRECSRCAKLLHECSCSTYSLESHFVKRVAKVYRYVKTEDILVQNALIYSLKEENRRDVCRFLAKELAHAISDSGVLEYAGRKHIIITNIPRRPSAIREYGYDHAALLAKEIAKILGLEYTAILSSRSRRAQKKLSVDERRAEISFKYRRKSEHLDLSDKGVIIIDDVITTGASMSHAAALIRALGARKIIAASIAIAYPDSHTAVKTVKR